MLSRRGIADRFGAAPTTIIGLTGIATGCLALAAMPRSLDIAGYIAPIVVLTAGYALFQTANNANVMSNVSSDGRGVTSGMLNVSRNLGLITSASVMGAVFSLAAGTGDVAMASHDAVATAMRITFLVAAALILAALAIARRTATTRNATGARRPPRPEKEALWGAISPAGLTAYPAGGGLLVDAEPEAVARAAMADGVVLSQLGTSDGLRPGAAVLRAGRSAQSGERFGANWLTPLESEERFRNARPRGSHQPTRSRGER